MRFHAGQEFEHCGVRYRIRAGNRRPVGDLIIEFQVVGWHRPTIAHTLILAAFKYQVEEHNYPRPHYLGGKKLIDALLSSMQGNLDYEITKIVQERVG